MQYKKHTEPFVELLCGISNSGKSTYVRTQYSEGFEGLILSRDDLVMKYGYGYSYNECWKSLTPELHQIIDYKLDEQFIEALSSRSNIIIDMVNLTKRKRAHWLKKIPNGYLRRIIVFHTPLNIIKERNILQRNEKYIPDNTLVSMHNRFQYPNLDECDEIIRMD